MEATTFGDDASDPVQHGPDSGRDCWTRSRARRETAGGEDRRDQRRSDAEVPGGRRDLPDPSFAGHCAERPLATRWCPFSAAAPFATRAFSSMLDAVCDYLPSPLDVPPVAGLNPATGEVQERRVDESEPFSALVFKIVSDPYRGPSCLLPGLLRQALGWLLRLQRHARARRSGLAACCRCTPTTGRISPRLALGTSRPRLA